MAQHQHPVETERATDRFEIIGIGIDGDLLDIVRFDGWYPDACIDKVTLKMIAQLRAKRCDG